MVLMERSDASVRHYSLSIATQVAFVSWRVAHMGVRKGHGLGVTNGR